VSRPLMTMLAIASMGKGGLSGREECGCGLTMGTEDSESGQGCKMDIAASPLLSARNEGLSRRRRLHTSFTSHRPAALRNAPSSVASGSRERIASSR